MMVFLELKHECRLEDSPGGYFLKSDTPSWLVDLLKGGDPAAAPIKAWLNTIPAPASIDIQIKVSARYDG